MQTATLPNSLRRTSTSRYSQTTAMPPPLFSPDSSFLFDREKTPRFQPRSWLLEVKVKTSLGVDKALLSFGLQSLHSIIKGKGGLFPCRRRPCYTCNLRLLRSGCSLTLSGRSIGINLVDRSASSASQV